MLIGHADSFVTLVGLVFTTFIQPRYHFASEPASLAVTLDLVCNL